MLRQYNIKQKELYAGIKELEAKLRALEREEAHDQEQEVAKNEYKFSIDIIPLGIWRFIVACGGLALMFFLVGQTLVVIDIGLSGSGPVEEEGDAEGGDDEARRRLETTTTKSVNYSSFV